MERIAAARSLHRESGINQLLLLSCVGSRPKSQHLRLHSACLRRIRCCASGGDGIGMEATKDGTQWLDDQQQQQQQQQQQRIYTKGAEGAVEAEAAFLSKTPPPSLNLENEETISTTSLSSDSAVQSLAANNMVEQARQIFLFAGPALGIWLSGPIMSLIDTSVVGTKSSLELAALGPGTVLCDGLGYVFMFLSVATSNLIATSLALKNEKEAANHLGRLLFVALACGVGMLVVLDLFSTTLLQVFVGQNTSLVPAASTYVKIRGYAWPVVLVTMVAQSACLGMQDSWSPLKVLAVASLLNAVGDIVLCTYLDYGIAGAAWATTASQYVAAALMLKSLDAKGYNPFALVIPMAKDLSQMIEIAAPVLLTMFSKVCFYTTLTYMATSLGPVTLGAHQVMIGVFTFFSVVGEPLAQTAQSFMPALLYGKRQNVEEARRLLKALLMIGAGVGAVLAAAGLSVPLFLPQVFTKDTAIISQMKSIAAPFFCATMLVPPTLALEGTLLAGRDMRYLGFSMASCFSCSALVLWLCHRFGLGLRGSWWALVFFQMTRFMSSFERTKSPKNVLNRTEVGC